MKVNEENVPLEGVTIGIYDSNDNFISECITNEQGIIEIKLEYGTYYYQEISTIDGYILSTEKVYFDITKGSDEFKEVVLNTLNEIRKNNFVFIWKRYTGIFVDSNDRVYFGIKYSTRKSIGFNRKYNVQ